MKTRNYIFVLIGIFTLSFTLLSCGGSEAPVEDGETANRSTQTQKGLPEKSLEEQITDKIALEAQSGERMDTIVLDFTFGMEKMDVYKHTKALSREKKMYKITKRKNVWEYVYDIRLRKAGKLRTFFEAFYYKPDGKKKDELYMVECLPKIDTTQHVPIDVVKELRDVYKAEYGKHDFIVPSEEDPDCKTYMWIKHNLKIELGCEEDKVFIYYTDIPMAEMAAKDGDL